MILYRVQVVTVDDDSWMTEWYPSQSVAKQRARMLAEAYHDSPLPKIDRVNVPTSKEGLCWAMNHADMHRMNFEGEEEIRYPYTPPKQRSNR